MTATTTSPTTAGDDEATLVRRGLPLVQHIVSDVAARVPRSVPREDLVSAGMLGLAQAARAWDRARGVTFETFARTRITGAMLDELRSRDWASRSVRADARKLQAIREELTATLGRPPSSEELAARGIDPDTARRLDADVRRAAVLSYEAVVADPDGPAARLASHESPVDAQLARELSAVLGDAVAVLPERLRTVVLEYFFEERSMKEIAARLGVTESRVSQMRAEALALLRDGVNSQLEPAEVADLRVDHGRLGRRKAAYYAAIAGASTAQERLAADEPLPQRVAAILARSA